MKKQQDYKEVLAKLREKHADKIEPLFLAMYKIAMGKDEDGESLGIEPKDSVNAGKVCTSILGLPKAATEKTDSSVATKIDKPTLSKEQTAVLDEILGPKK